MTPKTDSVAVLREPIAAELHRLGYGYDESTAESIACVVLRALSAQGEAWVDEEQDIDALLRRLSIDPEMARADGGRLRVSWIVEQITTPLRRLSHPAPGGVADAVTDWTKVENVAVQYVDDYEFMGEDENGNEGAYQPNEGERTMILDAMFGLFSDPEFQAALAARTEVPHDPG